MEDGQTTFGTQLGLAGITGIQKQDSFHSLLELFVRVAEDDDVRLFLAETRGEWFREGVRVDDMMEENFYTADFQAGRERKTEVAVAVAQHGGHGRDALKFENHGGKADVAGMEDVVNALENFFDMQVKVSVRVGDNTDFQ